MKRISILDQLRGFSLILMLIDHSRSVLGPKFDIFHPGENAPILFGLRFFLNLCVPHFFILAGISVYVIARKMPEKSAALFILSRSIIIILFDLLVTKIAYQPNTPFLQVHFSVLTAIAVGMILSIFFIRCPPIVPAVLGLSAVALHNLLDRIQPDAMNFSSLALALLHRPQIVEIGSGVSISFTYNFLPWSFLVLLGLGIGKCIDWDSETRARWCFRIGLACVALFVCLRTLNGYGDPNPWLNQGNFLQRLTSFLDTQKYPVSLMNFLMTLGPFLLFQAWLEKAKTGAFLAAIEVLGTVPLFFYIFHLVLLSFISTIFGGHRFGIGVSSLIAFVALLVMLPVCKKYRAIKESRRIWILNYI